MKENLIVKEVERLWERKAPIIQEYVGRDYSAYRGLGQCTQKWVFIFHEGKYSLVEEKKEWHHYDRRYDPAANVTVGGDSGGSANISTPEEYIVFRNIDPTGTESRSEIGYVKDGEEYTLRQEQQIRKWYSILTAALRF